MHFGHVVFLIHCFGNRYIPEI